MSYGAQAAWRLGKWDILQKFMAPHLRRLPDVNSPVSTGPTSPPAEASGAPTSPQTSFFNNTLIFFSSFSVLFN
jgi:hypothetical protein